MRIYVIDDDRIELHAWARTAGFRSDVDLYTFDDFESFKVAFEHTIPDVAVVDLIMPHHSGVEVLLWVYNNHPNVRLYVSSGKQGDEFVILAESFNATYLEKITMGHVARLEVIRGSES